MKRISLSALLLSAAALFAAEHAIRMHAHRGEPHLAPQNTVESIKLAYELGALMIETDVNLTKYGQMVIVHDRRELKKNWGIDKNPADLTPEEIKNAKLANPGRFDAKYANCKMPLLDDILAAIPKDKRFELEIKEYGAAFADNVEAARKKAGLGCWNILVTSFNPEYIKDFKQKYPKYRTLLIVDMNPKYGMTLEKIIENAKYAGADEVAVNGYHSLDKAFFDKFKAAGFTVGVWQVESLDDLAKAAELGANRVCSNHAYRLREKYKLIKNLDFK